MPRLGPLLVLAIAAFVGATNVSAAPVGDAHASKTCDVRSVERKLGPTYVTSLSASGVSCGSAKRLVKAFHACRRANGGVKGRCAAASGYRCNERRTSIPTQFSAKVTCRRSGATVVHTYTQFT